MHQGTKSGGLTAWQLCMLSLGSVVGGSFFLATSVILQSAGPSSLVAFAVGGVLIFLTLRALSEMTVSRPAHGSFREYAANAFGPMAGFVVGWLYWSGLVLALSSEATASALFARLWLPRAPVWLLSLTVIVAVTLLNMLDVRLFATVESVMAAVKLLAIVAFILLMVLVLFGLWPGRPAVGLGMLRQEPFMPGGAGGLAGSMLIVLFSYAGFEVLGLAAPEAREPARTVPRAVLLTVVLLVGLYITAMVVMLPVLPLGTLEKDVSPMVRSLQLVGFPRLAPVFNFIILTASLSTMVAATYSLSRMLLSLAHEGQAPAVLKRTSPTGAPRNATLASAGGMLVGVVLAYLLPKQVYLFLVSSSGFALLFAYLMILASQMVIRRREGCREGMCQMPAYPYGTWLGIIGIVAAIAAMPLVPGQGAGLVAGLAMLVFFCVAYLMFQRRAGTPGPAPEPEETDERVLLR